MSVETRGREWRGLDIVVVGEEHEGQDTGGYRLSEPEAPSTCKPDPPNQGSEYVRLEQWERSGNNKPKSE